MTENLTYFQRLQKIKLDKLPKEAVAKPRKPLNKVSPKTKEKEKALKDSKGDGALDLWFEERRKEMKGKCQLCGGKTEKSNNETYRRSIHHLLDKRKGMFPSLATHQSNWIEVCFWGNSCHTNLHNGTITFELLKDSKEWVIIKPKLQLLLPLCNEEEKKLKLYSKLIELIKK